MCAAKELRLLAAQPQPAVDVPAGWRSIESAPKDHDPILLRFKDEIPVPGRDLQQWAGLVFVGRHHGGTMDWGFAAPVGMGGFPDSWLHGWMPIPPGDHDSVAPAAGQSHQ